MKSIGLTNNGISIFKEYDLKPANIHSNCRPLYLQAHSIKSGDGELSASGALSIRTGKYTGRAPKDRYIVIDNITSGSIDWGKVNKPYDRDDFIELREKMVAYMEGKEIYQQDVAACADPNYQLKIRLLAEKPWSAQFATNMFLRIEDDELITFDPQWYILCVPSFTADPDKDNTRSENFVIIDFSRQEILIGGTGYTGEIKKSIFSVLNFLLPREDNVLPMHCSATEGKEGDTAIYFGLSGTGKTTLSADKDRILIGDDEHGWSDKGIFNFEGGCYAKCIGLTPEKEPEIYNAIKDGAILENIIFNPGTRIPNYSDQSITQNTRVSYPIYHIPDAKHPSMGGHPKNIFFLTCDAFGVLPPISKLTPGQAMYHFISGYTAKVAGTEEGVSEPEATFSACFGAPFLPLHPTEYANMLGKKMKEHGTKVWLINTGWSSGSYGVGQRINLKYTRAMVSAALNGSLDHVRYTKTDIFNLDIPTFCPGVPSDILNPRNTWVDRRAYDEKCEFLAQLFVENIEEYIKFAEKEIVNAGPKLPANV